MLRRGRPRRRDRGLALAGALAASGLSTNAFAFSPAVDYAVHCQGCHLADGAETPGSVPALAGTVGRLAGSAAGRAYMARVPGVAQSPLGDAELAALLNWVVVRFGAEAAQGFAPYTPAEIGRLRAEPLVDVGAARRAVLGASGSPE